MTKEQFEDIKSRAWSWYRGNMLEWAVNSLRDIDNSESWIKSLFNGLTFDKSLDFDDFLDCYEDEVETLLVESQTRNFGVNYTKEILEYQVALRDGNEYEMIDALCDMSIIMCNSGFGFDDTVYRYMVDEDLNVPSNLGEVFEVLSHYLLVDVILHIRRKGYDPYLCLLETIKELNSRTGFWNEKEGKWCKDIGAYTLEEAIEKVEEVRVNNFLCDDFVLRRTTKDFWIFGAKEEMHLSESECSEYLILKVKKWYKADYNKFKLEVENEK